MSKIWSETMKCKICGNETKNIYDNEIEANYYICDVCEFIYQEESSHISIDEELEEYNYHENTLDNEGYVRMLNNFLSIGVDPFICKGRALDYGSGPGPVLAYLLKERGFDSKTYDLFYDHDKDYDKYKYDLITCTEVVEHFKDPMFEFTKFSSLLNQNGYVVIMTNMHKKNIDDFLKWWYRKIPSHIGFYSLKTFDYIAKYMQCEVVYTDSNKIIVMKRKSL